MRESWTARSGAVSLLLSLLANPADAATLTPTLSSPAASAKIKGTFDVTFQLPEAAQSGSVTLTFTATGGTSDSNGPHVITFKPVFESLATHDMDLGPLSSAATDSSTQILSLTSGGGTAQNLVDGAVYTVELSYQDTDGNTAATASSTSVTFDTTAPTLSTVTAAGGSVTATHAKVGDSITLTIASSEDLASVSATIAGVTATVTGSGQSWSAAATLTNSESEGLAAFTIDFQDSAGNTGTQVTDVTSGAKVTIDKTAPTITPLVLVSNNAINTAYAKAGDNVVLTLTSNEDLATPTISLSSVSTTVAATTGQTVWTGTVAASSLAEGVVSYSVTCTDLAGNACSPPASTTDSSSVTVDKTAPTLSLALSGSGMSKSAVITFSEEVTDEGTNQLQLSDLFFGLSSGPFGTATLGSSIALTVDSNTQVTIAMDLQGTLNDGEQYVAANAKNGKIIDRAGNIASHDSSMLRYTRLDKDDAQFSVVTSSGQVEFYTSS